MNENILDLEIIPMKREHCYQVANIEAKSISCPWSEQAFLDTLEKQEAFYYVAKLEEKVVGYIGAWQSFEEADITNIAVTAEKRGYGIGKALIKFFKEMALNRGITALTLEVRVSNQVAIHLYEKMGFSSEGIRPNFYERPKEDAMIMWNRNLRGITIEKQEKLPV